jgi:GNAT superfamily N-acetyltransferase
MAPTPEVCREIAHAALVLPSPLDRYRPNPGWRAAHGAFTLVADGDRGPAFNRVVVLGPVVPDHVFAPADAFFAYSFSIVIERGVADPLETVLQARGWRLDEEEPALVLAPIPDASPHAPADLDIRQVVDAAGLADFRNVSQTPSVYLPSLAAALDPAIALLVGYVGGRAVATARVTCLASIVELMGIVTVAAARRQGYGTALTWAALAAGRVRGCTAATLTATAMGLPLYQGIGFQLAGIYRTYLPPQME